MPLPPGLLFVGSIYAQDRPFISALLKAAHQAGYTRLVEPAAGSFAFSQLAVQAGWNASQCDTSDVSLFSAVYGYAMMGKPLDDLGLELEPLAELARTPVDLADPAEVLWLMTYLMQRRQAKNLYLDNFLQDTLLRRTTHVARIRETLEQARPSLGGLQYRTLDLHAHIAEALDDPHALIILNAPTYSGGNYESWFDTDGALRWAEPTYDLYDPSEGLNRIMEQAEGRAALLLSYQQRMPGEWVGTPLYARALVRSGGWNKPSLNAYFCTNNERVAHELLPHAPVVPKPLETWERLDFPLLPSDYEPGPDAKIGVFPLNDKQAAYYRQLWTHKFQFTGSAFSYAVVLDGYLAGILGYQTTWTYWHDPTKLFLLFNMTPPNTKYRYTRLLKYISFSKWLCDEVLPPLVRGPVTKVYTTQVTPHPSSMDMRGIMKMTHRKPDPIWGFKLTYEAEIRDWTLDEAYAHWHAEEMASKQRRAESKVESKVESKHKQTPQAEM